MKFDLLTILTAYLIIDGVFAIAFAITVRRHPDLAGPRWWLGACIALFTGFLVNRGEINERDFMG